MPRPRLTATETRPTTRTIAALVGVSSATVSLALRNHPRISVQMRETVQRAAIQLGYRPDPQVAKLMHHLRKRQRPGFQSTICAITTITEEKELPYLRDILIHARKRADSLGHGFMLMRLNDEQAQRPDLHRVLRSRGVEGVLLAPMIKPRSFDGLLSWKDYSVVAATNGVLSPEFHRVVPHQFSNMLVICSELAGRSYRRIGIVLNKEHDYSVNHAFTAAVSWQGLFGGTELVMPLIRTEYSDSEVSAWFKRERPDAIVVPGVANGKAVAKELNLRVPGPIGFATANRSGVSVFAGIDERPDAIGSAAIGLLASMIQRGEKGLPAVPTVTMIKGNWLGGKSLRQRLSAVSVK